MVIDVSKGEPKAGTVSYWRVVHILYLNTCANLNVTGHKITVSLHMYYAAAMTIKMPLSMSSEHLATLRSAASRHYI